MLPLERDRPARARREMVVKEPHPARPPKATHRRQVTSQQHNPWAESRLRIIQRLVGFISNRRQKQTR